MKKILVADDDAMSVLAIKTRLEVAGYQVFSAQDGRMAFEKLRYEKPDLVLIEVAIPKMDGFRFVQELRQQKEDLRRIPVIVLSSRPGTESLFVTGDISGVIRKPFDFGELLTLIQKTLQISEKERGTQKKALLVGMNWEAMRPIQKVLEMRGLAVKTVPDGPHAIEMAIQYKPHIVFVPSRISGMELYEFTTTWQGLPGTKKIPLIIYDMNALGGSGYAMIKASRILQYTDHDELTRKVDEALKFYV